MGRKARVPESEIEIIYFDLGNVILPITNRRRTVYKLAQKSKLSKEELWEIFSSTDKHERHKDFWEIICQFDRGETKALEVHREIAEYLESDMNYAEFVEIWQGMFGVDERFLDLISRMEGVRKGIISDLCTIHFEEASMLILMDIFEVKFFSFMEGLLKRDNGGELFARAIKLSGAEAENIVFVDDLKINVELAAAHGIRAFHYQNNFDAFVRFLKSLGVKIKPQ